MMVYSEELYCYQPDLKKYDKMRDNGMVNINGLNTKIIQRVNINWEERIESWIQGMWLYLCFGSWEYWKILRLREFCWYSRLWWYTIDMQNSFGIIWNRLIMNMLSICGVIIVYAISLLYNNAFSGYFDSVVTKVLNFWWSF